MILEQIVAEKLISQEQFDDYILLCDMAKSTSKKDIKKLYKKNSALRLIIQNISSLMYPLIKENPVEQECLSTVLGKITSSNL